MMTFLFFLLIFFTLSYHRASLLVWTIAMVTFLVVASRISGITFWPMFFSWMVLLMVFAPLYANSWRQQKITSKILKYYLKVMPTMSGTQSCA